MNAPVLARPTRRPHSLSLGLTGVHTFKIHLKYPRYCHEMPEIRWNAAGLRTSIPILKQRAFSNPAVA